VREKFSGPERGQSMYVLAVAESPDGIETGNGWKRLRGRSTIVKGVWRFFCGEQGLFGVRC